MEFCGKVTSSDPYWDLHKDSQVQVASPLSQLVEERLRLGVDIKLWPTVIGTLKVQLSNTLLNSCCPISIHIHPYPISQLHWTASFSPNETLRRSCLRETWTNQLKPQTKVFGRCSRRKLLHWRDGVLKVWNDNGNDWSTRTSSIYIYLLRSTTYHPSPTNYRPNIAVCISSHQAAILYDPYWQSHIYVSPILFVLSFFTLLGESWDTRLCRSVRPRGDSGEGVWRSELTWTMQNHMTHLSTWPQNLSDLSL